MGNLVQYICLLLKIVNSIFSKEGGGQSGTITTARENNSAVLTSEVLVKYRNPFKSCGRFFSNCTHSN